MIDQAADNRPTVPVTRDPAAAAKKQAEDTRTTVWAFVWTLFAFKIVTLGIIFWAASGSGEAGLILLATNWFWVLIPAFAISGPLLFRYRMRKARRRRAALLRAEWMVE